MPQDLLKNKTGSVRVRARFAKRDNEAGDAPDWSHPREVTLHIERRSKSLSRAKRHGDFAGDLLAMNVEDFGWAEYGAHHQCEGEFINQYLAEEYRMDVLEVL